jgi:lipopolysaccharide export system permease protein
LKNALKILDRYLLGKYLKTFGFTLLMFTMITVVIDFSGKTEDFITEPVSIKQILFDYYLNFVPHISLVLFPLYALISVIFFTSRLAYDSEVISVFNAGVSFKRFLRPYLYGAVILATIQLIAGHVMVPNGNKKRLAFEYKYIWKYSDKGKTDNVHLFIDSTTKVFIQYYRKEDSSATDFRLETFKGGKLVKILKANNIYWKGFPNKWQIYDYQIRSFDGLNEKIFVSKGRALDTTINITPKDFVKYQNEKEMMTSMELYNYIQKDRIRGEGLSKSYEIEMNRRTSEPISIIILTILGVAIAARKVRGGVGLHLALGIGLGAIFIFLSKVSQTFAALPFIPTLLAVWIPNLIFAIIALLLVNRAQT